MLCWVWGGAGGLVCNPMGGLDSPRGGLDKPIGGLELAGNSFSALKNSSSTFLNDDDGEFSNVGKLGSSFSSFKILPGLSWVTNLSERSHVKLLRWWYHTLLKNTHFFAFFVWFNVNWTVTSSKEQFFQVILSSITLLLSHLSDSPVQNDSLTQNYSQ